MTIIYSINYISTMSDDEFIDINEVDHDDEVFCPSPKRNDISWIEVDIFSSSELFFASTVYGVIKEEFVSARKRQFGYGLVQEYRCKYARKVGFTSCPIKYRVVFLSHCQDVRVERTEDYQEHVHEEANTNNKKTLNYFWTTTMTELINQCIQNHSKPRVVMR